MSNNNWYPVTNRALDEAAEFSVPFEVLLPGQGDDIFAEGADIEAIITRRLTEAMSARMAAFNAFHEHIILYGTDDAEQLLTDMRELLDDTKGRGRGVLHNPGAA